MSLWEGDTASGAFQMECVSRQKYYSSNGKRRCDAGRRGANLHKSLRLSTYQLFFLCIYLFFSTAETMRRLVGSKLGLFSESVAVL